MAAYRQKNVSVCQVHQTLVKRQAKARKEKHMTSDDWEKQVLDFWFTDLTAEDWFTRKDSTDATIRERFLSLHRALQTDVPAAAYAEANAALAAIIMFDQFPRNMFRGTAEAFSTDTIAVAIARNAVERAFDTSVGPDRRTFFYMPFMHSEVLADQERCISLFAEAGSDTKHAVEHRDIIQKFGRFPHRNRALGRESTQAELAFLGEHEGFGQ